MHGRIMMTKKKHDCCSCRKKAKEMSEYIDNEN